MYGNAFWEASIYADQQLELDERFAESSEGRFLYRLLEQESERLRRVLAAPPQADAPQEGQ